MLKQGTIPKFSLLNRCTNLVSLSLGGAWWNIFGLDDEQSDAFLETIAWLKECKQLRTLAFAKFPGGAGLMASILLQNSIHLTSLEYVGAGSPDTVRFVQALTNQTSLKFLYLEELEYPSTTRWFPEGADSLVESLSKLVNLTDLHVREMNDYFTDQHIIRLAGSLPKLRAWSTNGNTLSDDIWDAVASLRSLQMLEFGAVTHFTADGILEFIEKLGPGNKGLILDVLNSRIRLSKKEQKLIQEKITKKVGGEFGFFYNSGKPLIGCKY